MRVRRSRLLRLSRQSTRRLDVEARGQTALPALVISLIALFVALGGSAYAAKKIGSKEIKSNAITAGKIKKNAITTAKIQNNAVTGAKLNEGTLGAVPNATNAANAINAQTQNAQNFSKYPSSGLKKASTGQNVTVLTAGPFTITGKCKDEGGGYTSARLYITTSQVGSSVYASGGGYYEANFNPGQEVEVSSQAYDNSPYIYWSTCYDSTNGFVAASPDGSFLLRGAGVNAVNVFGAQCAWWVGGERCLTR